MSLIEALSPDHWQPHLVSGIQYNAEGVDCFLLHRDEVDIKFIASIWQSLPAGLYLLVAVQVRWALYQPLKWVSEYQAL